MAEANPGKLTKPKTMRVLLMNLGEKDAANVPGKSVAIAVLPVTAKWQLWKTWDIEVEGKRCEVLIYPKDIT